MTTVIEINTDAATLSVGKGFLLVRRDGTEDKIPLSDIESLIINAHGALISNHAIMRLAEFGIPIVHCATNAMPCAITLNYGANVYRKDRIQMQISSSLPLKKNLWQQVIKAKVKNQAAVLALTGQKHHDLEIMAGKVGSGDPGNIEAVAARAYWERLFGKGFRRKPELEGINSFLNYGYAILRASFCRNIVAAGLLPELGIHHHNQMNPFCLADDLMEPFRPMVDLLIKQMNPATEAQLTTSYKRKLISILELQLCWQAKETHLRFVIPAIVQNLVNSHSAKKAGLSFPIIDDAVNKALLEFGQATV